MTGVFIIVPVAAIVFCVCFALYERRKTKSIMETLNRILDKTIAGDFKETVYDETSLSQIESKLWRFLASSELAQKRVEKEQNRIKSLISDISHQTKTPIANILMYTGLLAEQQDLPEQTKNISGQIGPQAEKLNFLIQSLIKVSRLESGLIAVTPAANRVSELIADAVFECAPKAKAKGIACTVGEISDTVALFDAKWTAEALCNILDNAVKYTPPGGQITIRSTCYEMFVRIDIADSGMGIAEADYSKLFERFWRSSAAANEEGVGIGLYLSREIIAKQGGYIKVSSVPGKGSVFSVFLQTVGSVKSVRSEKDA